jgi:uncharacterized RDD family membrane protein YckC
MPAEHSSEGPSESEGRTREPTAMATTEAPRKVPGVEDFPATGPNSLAAPGPRFGARGIDLVIVAAPALVVVALSVTVRSREVIDVDLPVWLPWMVLGVGIAYEFVMLALWGRTLGKWLFGLRVARYTDGKRPDPGQALLRSLVPWAPFAFPVPFAFAIVLGMWATAARGALHRGVPDQAAGTIVVATR